MKDLKLKGELSKNLGMDVDEFERLTAEEQSKYLSKNNPTLNDYVLKDDKTTETKRVKISGLEGNLVLPAAEDKQRRDHAQKKVQLKKAYTPKKTYMPQKHLDGMTK